MQPLDLSAISSWMPLENRWVPQAVNTTCPNCGRAVNLTLMSPQYDPVRRTVSATSGCPACQLNFWMWVIEPRAVSEEKGCTGIMMFPPPGKLRGPLYGATLMPERILSLYRQALNVYNARLWNVSVGVSRQILEAVARALLPSYEVQESISQNIKRLSNGIDVKKPITDIAFLIREGGKLLPFLAQQREPSEEIASQILDLTECLLQYIFTLPREAADMRQKVEGFSATVRKAG